MTSFKCCIAEIEGWAWTQPVVRIIETKKIAEMEIKL
jgi:hypothetical protein